MKRLVKTLLAGALVAAPMVGFAAIDSTHHDMTKYAGAVEKCAYCHSKSLAVNQVSGVTLGQVGTFCAIVCHDGTLAGSAVAAPDYMVATTFAASGSASLITGAAALGNSHGFTNAVIPGPDAAADVTATGWPHTQGTMQCTSCHAVHDGANPPFLNGPLSGADNAASFCQKCHTGSAAAGTAGRFQTIATRGAHPTEFDLTAALGGAGPAADATKHGRDIAFKSPLLGVKASVTTTVAAFGLTTGGNQWKMGGHFQGANNLPADPGAGAKFGCYSCHSVHQAGTSGGTALDTALQNTLVLGPYDNVAANATESTLCVSCHGLAAKPNMGYNDPGKTSYSHPTNGNSGGVYQHDHADHVAASGTDANLPAAGTFPVDVAALTSAAVGLAAKDVGQTSEVLCVSCHDVHGGISGKMALKDINGVTANPTNFCNYCHGTATGLTQSGNNWHHPTTATGANAAAFANPAWSAAWNVDLSTGQAGGLDCSDCHVFNGTAHNW